MKKIFFAGAVLAALAATSAPAQRDGEGRGRFAQPQTRAAVQAQVQARFARADSNRDGFVTRDEVRARAEDRFGARAFAAMDLDGDGRVAFAEAQRAALQRF